MTLGTGLAIVRLVLTIVSYFMKQAEKAELEKAILNDLQVKHRKRTDAAVAAGDDIRAGRVPVDPDDPNDRDARR